MPMLGPIHVSVHIAGVMRPLILNKPTLDRIAQVVARAQVERFPRAYMAAAYGERSDQLFTTPPFCVDVPAGYRCMLTIEERRDIGWVRHLSVTTPSGHPVEGAMVELIRRFGFTRPLSECVITVGRAVHVAEVLSSFTFDKGVFP